MRYEEPERFEMLVTKGPTLTLCHLVADRDRWQIEFPVPKRTISGSGTPGNEELALWVESRKMVAEAIRRAQSTDPFTETTRGTYKSGRQFEIELSQFRQIVGQIIATRMRLTCQGCASSLEIALHDLR